MALATVAELKAACDEGNDRVKAAINEVLNRPFGSVKFTEGNLQEFLNRTRQDTLQNRHYKGLRPWDIVNVSERLDSSKTWIGMEYETGYDNSRSYQAVVNYVWNNFNLVAIDREGCSDYPSEITFAPVHLEDFLSDDYHLNKLFSFQAENGHDQSYDPEIDGEVGIHCNISTPAYRELDYCDREWIEGVLTNSVFRLDDDEMEDLFGRVPYAGFFCQQDDNNVWLEGKLFKTTGDIDVLDGYKKVVARIAKLIDLLAAEDKEDRPIDKSSGKKVPWYETGGTTYLHVKNFWSYLMGRDEEIELGYSIKRNPRFD